MISSTLTLKIATLEKSHSEANLIMINESICALNYFNHSIYEHVRSEFARNNSQPLAIFQLTSAFG